MPENTRQPARRREGSAYVMILGVSMILAVIGLSAVAVCRINGRMVRSDRGWAESQVLAFSAAEHALAAIAAHSDWRDRYAGRTVATDFGRGTMSWQLVDEQDGDLADDPAEAFVVLARGQVDKAAYALKLRCRPLGEGLDLLRTAAHADGQVDLGRRANVRLTDGPLSTNDMLRIDRRAVLVGDVEAAAVSGGGTIRGTVTAPAPAKAMPDPATFDTYLAVATPLGRRTSLDRVTLSKWSNPFGRPNADGVYSIDARGRNVTIRDSLIYGTLVVRCRRLTVSGWTLMRNARDDYATLVVSGDADLSVTAWPTSRPVPWRGPGANPWAGASGAFYDSFAGLVHATGNVTVSTDPHSRGPIVAGGRLTCNTPATLRADPALLDKPPVGYSSGGSAVYCDGWLRVVE